MKKINQLFILIAIVFISSLISAQAGTYPGGTIILTNDGNHHDQDDIGALPITMALAQAAGLASKVALIEHSNHIGYNSETQHQKMIESANGAADRFGFSRSIIYDVWANPNAASSKMAAVINAASSSEPVWIVAAGPMESIWRGITKASQSKRQYVRIISHGGWNENHVDGPELTHTWQNLKDTYGRDGVIFYDIIDQNSSDGDNDFNTANSKWYWLRDSNKEPWRWLYSRNQFSNKFDVSDAGMLYWLISGGPNGGDDKGGWPETKKLFENPITDPNTNKVPIVSITNPLNNASYILPVSLTIEATASDPDGSVTKVVFYQNNILLGEDNSSPYSFVWNNIPKNNYVINAVAFDDKGASSTTSVSITVTDTSSIKRDAFIKTEAEILDGSKGITLGTTNFSYFDTGDWALYQNMDFKTGATSIDINLSSKNSGRKIELRLDSPTGTLIGTLNVATTGSWTTYTTQSTAINNANGIHDLYLVGVGGTGVANVDWFIFKADTPTSTDIVYAINAGGNAYTSTSGIAYSADKLYSGGKAASTSNTISGTSDQAIYKTERYGNVTYNLPISNGQYEVNLQFCEFYHSAIGKRIFDVLIEGQELISNLDIFKEAGKNAAYNRTLTVNVGDGQLNIQFVNNTDNAKISGILIKSVNTQKSLLDASFPEKEEQEIIISPNPVTDIFRISGIDNSRVEIYNSSGIQVKVINKYIQEIDISELSSGIYFIKVFNNESIISKSIIKK